MTGVFDVSVLLFHYTYLDVGVGIRQYDFVIQILQQINVLLLLAYRCPLRRAHPLTALVDQVIFKESTVKGTNTNSPLPDKCSPNETFTKFTLGVLFQSLSPAWH